VHAQQPAGGGEYGLADRPDALFGEVKLRDDYDAARFAEKLAAVRGRYDDEFAPTHWTGTKKISYMGRGVGTPSRFNQTSDL